jgi:putative colanic acid biosynthesis acetyltransferase WcaF
MELVKLPITIGNDVWVAADAYVGPGVTIGDRAIVGARASAFRDVPADMVAMGNPAQTIQFRDFTDEEIVAHGLPANALRKC